MKELTQKQYNFALNYVKNGFNGYKAAVDAGYDNDVANATSYKLIKHPEIKSMIQIAQEKAHNKLVNELSITYTWKLAKLKRVVEEYIPDDKKIALEPLKVKVGLQALSEMNKMQGDFAPDKRLSVTVDATKDRLLEAQKAYEEY